MRPFLPHAAPRRFKVTQETGDVLAYRGAREMHQLSRALVLLAILQSSALIDSADSVASACSRVCTCVDLAGGSNLATGAEQVDGNETTYWDESDGGAEYRLRLRLAAADKGAEYRLRLRLAPKHDGAHVGGVSITGYSHHNHAPRGFRLLCDGQVVLQIQDAVYTENVFLACFPATACGTAEMVIDAWFGASPAIREVRLVAALES
ncbi:hypothetical protein T484DRAFT_1891988 [Baffinella frigidus]|nr:hypothetical protein T484DRAFT_1891988 [Cryptophyta sp. CCMP2293]